MKVDVGGLEAGVYHVRVVTDGGSVVRRFVKQ